LRRWGKKIKKRKKKRPKKKKKNIKKKKKKKKNKKKKKKKKKKKPLSGGCNELINSLAISISLHIFYIFHIFQQCDSLLEYEY